MQINEDVAHPFEVLPNFLSDEHCDYLITMWGRHLRREPDNIVRDCLWCPIPLYEELSLVAQLSNAMRGLNEQYWKFQTTKIERPLQFLKYDVNRQFDAWHLDTQRHVNSRRKVSITIQLSDSNDYEGGDLLLLPDVYEPRPEFRQRGTAIVFPSFMAHKVCRVESGSRYSLIGFLCGPPYV